MNIGDARTLLEAAGVFFDNDDLDPRYHQMLNMNDVWGWATADGEYVEDEELPEVARLFCEYGWCGLLYWVSQKRGGIVSEFADVNRFIEFARTPKILGQDTAAHGKR